MAPKGKKKDQASTDPDLDDILNQIENVHLEKAEKNAAKKAKKKAAKATNDEGTTETTDLPVAENGESAELAVVKETVDVEKAPDDGPKADDGDGEDASKSKKDKKKKDKKKEDKKEDKETAKPKGARAKLVAQIQEQQRLLKEEEDRRLREEEDLVKRQEEAERERLETLRLEKERKDKKKQKEKERIERLKKEGKFLTPKQKADRQRALEMVEMLKAQGIVVGKKPAKQNSKDKVEDGDDGSDKAIQSNETAEEVEEKTEDLADEEPEEVDDVLDDWEEALDKPEPVKQPVAKKSEPKISPTVASNKITLSGNTQEVEAPTGLRSPIICVLGHVDTGKTKLLDYLRKTHVQDNEAGGITQQIGATYVPPTAIHEQRRAVKEALELELPGLLIIDTPGHESFTNLRSRGSSLCDIAILVIDIMHGLEPQTIESINLLKSRKTPFIVALNKIDRLYGFKGNRHKDIHDIITSQEINVKLEFEKRTNDIVAELNVQSLNAALYYSNPDIKSYVSLVPTSAHSGDGMGNLINLLVSYSQSFLAKKLTFDPNRLECTVLEVKALPGLGTTVDVVLVNGKLNAGDTIVLAGHDGPIVTQIRALLVPQPLRELRVKSPYQELKTVYGAMGIKVTGHDMEKAVAGLELNVSKNEADTEKLRSECWERFGQAMKSIKCSDKGVHVQASTLGSLEALLQFLKDSKIPYSSVRIGPVVKRDVIKASTMLELAPDYAVILAFDVKVEKDAEDIAKKEGVHIFTAEIIYHLFDKFTAYREEIKAKKKEKFRNVAVFPCKLRILPQCIFNARDPIVVGVSIEEGSLRSGTPIAVPSKENLFLGNISSIEINHKEIETATRGQEVCIKIDHTGGDAPKLYGRHFDHTDILVSRITRDSIDAVKEYFRDEMTKTDWQLVLELKKAFEIM
ncbi:Eukaryotic translation initiation factor 5B [Halotydeus destructor]|nr:Eukaryotic translation initiation factor 5B [Halotydeus destructor]